MMSPAPNRTPVETLDALLEAQQQANVALEMLQKQVEYAELLLESINRRLWAQNIVAWFQLASLVMTLLFLLLIILGVFGRPSLFSLLPAW
jgi:hypothetical protein